MNRNEKKMRYFAITSLLVIAYLSITNFYHKEMTEQQIIKTKELIVKSEQIHNELVDVKAENSTLLIEEKKLYGTINLLKKENKTLQDNKEDLRKEVTKLKKAYGSVSDWLDFTSTAYTTWANGDDLSAKKWGNKTASGTTVKQGRTIAVDTTVIPLGSKVQIKFPAPYSHLDGIYFAEDTGDAIKGHKIDVYFDNINVVNKYGIRNIKLRVIK